MKALAILLLVGRVAAADDSWRCPNGIVKVGDAKGDAQGRCGAPTKAESHEESSAVRGVHRRVTVDTWTYDRGRNELVRVLTFEDGVLTSIEVGGYGGTR